MNFLFARLAPVSLSRAFPSTTDKKISSAEHHEPTLVLCDECAFKPQLTNACAEHTFIKHFLVLVRNPNAWYIQGGPKPEPKGESEADGPTIQSLQAQISQLLELVQDLRMSLAARSAPE